METMTGNGFAFDGFDTSDEAVDRLRHRIHDVASELKPLATVEELSARIRTVAAELHEIERQLLLVVHVRQAEAEGLFGKLDEIDSQLAEGWKPDGASAEDVVVRLRSQII